MISRRSAREAALTILFQEDFCEGSFSNLERLKMDQPNVDALTQKLVRGVFLRHEEIDRLISEHAEHWSCERITPIDRNILRIAVCELLFLKETPSNVILDEAIEIAKKYGSERSGAFINGVLDSILAGVLRMAGATTGMGPV